MARLLDLCIRQCTTPLLCLLFVCFVNAQQTDDRPKVQPYANAADCICKPEDTLCKCTFVVEHRLSMVLHEERELVRAVNGYLVKNVDDNKRLTKNESERVITTDGVGSRLVIAINGKFPGPRVDVFENQEIEITVVNTFHTDSVTVHFHGIHQKDTPWMDGVAFITQCPILPGQSFVYRFKAYPPGTSFYHAHIGDQRSMGLYGPFIVRKRDVNGGPGEIIVALQDWNHNMDAETAYMRMITEQYDFGTNPPQIVNTTVSVDNGNFSRFEFKSGLINGKGRYWKSATEHNSAPLEIFKVTTGRSYRFRVIGAMTLYPMRVYIEGIPLSLRSSDCFNIEDNDIGSIQSIIVHPGERYDFLATFTDNIRKQYLLIAETIETRASHGKYHAAEAIIFVDNAPGSVNLAPPNNKDKTCLVESKCKTFNCPYGYTGTNTNNCLNFNDVKNTDPYGDPSKVQGNKVDNEYFFKFAFPGFPGNTPGSVNAREFIPPTSPLLTQPNGLTTRCNEEKCREKGVCGCTYIQEIPGNKLIQMTFMNIGNGSGWSHPVHLHGHSFFVMKMGFGTYNAVTGQLIDESTDIKCTDKYGFCSQMEWADSTWNGGNIPGQNPKPPTKDTIVVPTGGYVVIRFISDNPGMWFLHCHIDLHNTNGMGMVVNVNPGNHPKPPTGFPTCGSFFNNGKPQPDVDSECRTIVGDGNGSLANGSFVFSLLVALICAMRV
ncbi:uncharacterized protein LOC132719624 [Ruditapes philippinarum]|uniref:uncharacterized protein LOC132719624 n=1 Tax=Ruditapes philippinarum TaxID=129788 RepID=UPI00295BAD6D|nr:uncharacterized protein LOC132719624 [Ruditapes philippinarum]XP_060559410.1 uncharacterized protein LOC132719624 [Ruditapes philippinarum]